MTDKLLREIKKIKFTDIASYTFYVQKSLEKYLSSDSISEEEKENLKFYVKGFLDGFITTHTEVLERFEEKTKYIGVNNTFKSVKALPNYVLEFKLKNDTIKHFDMKPYLERGDFKSLKNWDIFKTVKLDYLEGIEWNYKNLSISKDTILAHLY